MYFHHLESLAYKVNFYASCSCRLYFTSSASLSIMETDPEAIKSSSTIASISLWAVRMPRMFPVRKIDAWATSSSDLLSEPQVDNQRSTNYVLLILARTGLICDFYLALERLSSLKICQARSSMTYLRTKGTVVNMTEARSSQSSLYIGVSAVLLNYTSFMIMMCMMGDHSLTLYSENQRISHHLHYCLNPKRLSGPPPPPQLSNLDISSD